MIQDHKTGVDRTEVVIAITTVTLTGLGVLQVFLGETVSRSVSLTANGFECIGDGFVSAIIWIGLRFFRRPADSHFHFGYYKIENLASIAAAIVMFILAGYIFFRSYDQLVRPQYVQLPIIGAIVAFSAGLVAIVLGVYKFNTSKRTNIHSVKLDAINTIIDGSTSFLTVVALMLSVWGLYIADALIGFIIAGAIVIIGFAAIKQAGYMLVDACDGDCLMYGLLIKTYAERVKGVQEAKVVRLRRTGPVIQGELEVTVSGDMSISEFHAIKTEIIRLSSEKISELERLTITAVPSETT